MKFKNLEKSYLKCGGETSLRPFSKRSIWSYLLIKSLRFYIICFVECSSLGQPKFIELRCWTLAFTSYKALQKKPANGQELVSLSFFLDEFQRKIFMLYFVVIRSCSGLSALFI